MGRIGQPIVTLGNIGPASDMRQTHGQRINVAVQAIAAFNALGQPALGDKPVIAAQKAKHLANECSVLAHCGFTKIGDLRHFPQQAQRRFIAQSVKRCRVAAQ